jgi:hypothetical protein
MANVDTDDILPQVTIENFSYSVVNCQDPYITRVQTIEIQALETEKTK